MLRAHFAVIDDQYYAINQRDLAAFKKELLAAVHDGGAFLQLGTSDHPVDVLVTPHTPVRLEHPQQQHAPSELSAMRRDAADVETDIEWGL